MIEFTPDNKLSTELREKLIDKYAENTVEAYESAMRQFLSYCDSRSIPKQMPFEVEVIKDYIFDYGVYYKPSNLQLFVAAISAIQNKSGLKNNENTAKDESIKEALHTVSRKNDHRVKQAKALVLDELEEVFLSHTWKFCRSEIRDRAMILIGFYGGMRRNEILELKYEDLEYNPEKGYVIYIRHSKTDQKSKGMYKAIPFNRSRPEVCAVTAMDALINERGKKKGYLFTKIPRSEKITNDKLTPKGFDYIFDKYFKKYSSHSLRSGFVTTAFQKGAAVNSIMNQVGHKDSKTTYGYNRSGNIWIDNAVNQLIG